MGEVENTEQAAETPLPTVRVYELSGSEPKGLPLSVCDAGRIKGGFRFQVEVDGQVREVTALDFTMTNTFAKCPLEFCEAYVRGIGPKRQKVSLGFGGAYHLGLATWYRTLDVEMAAEAFLKDFVDIEGEELKTRVNGEAMVRAYIRRYASENWEVLEVETPIVFMFGPGLYHVVIPDMVVRENGRIYGVEHKHTKSIHKSYFKQFKPNQQIDGQVAGIRAKFGQCDGVIINPVEIQKGGRLGRPSPYFGFGPRDISTRTEEEIEWWRRDMVQVYRDIDAALAGQYFRASKSRCHDFEGCAFRELHTNLGDPYILEEQYGPRVWNPVDRLKEAEGVE